VLYLCGLPAASTVLPQHDSVRLNLLRWLTSNLQYMFCMQGYGTRLGFICRNHKQTHGGSQRWKWGKLGPPIFLSATRSLKLEKVFFKLKRFSDEKYQTYHFHLVQKMFIFLFLSNLVLPVGSNGCALAFIGASCVLVKCCLLKNM